MPSKKQSDCTDWVRVCEGDEDDISLELLEWSGLYEVWSSYDLDGWYDFFRDVALISTKHILIESEEYDYDFPGRSGHSYVITTNNPKALKQEFRDRVAALLWKARPLIREYRVKQQEAEQIKRIKLEKERAIAALEEERLKKVAALKQEELLKEAVKRVEPLFQEAESIALLKLSDSEKKELETLPQGAIQIAWLWVANTNHFICYYALDKPEDGNVELLSEFVERVHRGGSTPIFQPIRAAIHCVAKAESCGKGLTRTGVLMFLRSRVPGDLHSLVGHEQRIDLMAIDDLWNRNSS